MKSKYTLRDPVTISQVLHFMKGSGRVQASREY